MPLVERLFRQSQGLLRKEGPVFIISFGIGECMRRGGARGFCEKTGGKRG